MSSLKVFALVDCNSFYCSCERLFRPELREKPVIVLSNNDGCVIARTAEAKALGISMGEPFFRIKKFCELNDVHVFSTNFSLYTDISSRIMSTLKKFAPKVEVYSVDEAFLDLTGMKKLSDYGQSIKETIYSHVGIPVGVGIAPTKVLAKLANHIAKHSLKANGVVCLMERKHQNIALARVGIKDVWGIGKRSAEKLTLLGIKSAKDFRDFENEELIRRILTKVGLQIKHELMGINCFSLEEDIEKKKEIMCSRSLTKAVVNKEELKECVASYITDAAVKLRRQNSFCCSIHIFALNPFFSHSPEAFMSESIKLINPTCDTGKLIKAAFLIIDKSYKYGSEFKKIGVKLSDFFDSCEYQVDFLAPSDSCRDLRLMKTVDRVNLLNDKTTLKSMACGTQGTSWRMNRRYMSDKFTTDWNALLILD